MINGRSGMNFWVFDANQAPNRAPVVYKTPGGLRTSESASFISQENKDMEGENFIALNSSSPFRMNIDDAFDKAGIRRKICIETRIQPAICNLVAAGAGISLVDPLIAKPLQEKLAIRPFKPIISWSQALLAPSHRGMSLVAQSFSDRVCKHFEI